MERGRPGCCLSLSDPPHAQVITPVLQALVCLISYFCVFFLNLFLLFLYLCTVKYTPKNIDDCINHWCYITHYRCTWHLFTILTPCFVFVLILLYMCRKAVNVTMISSSPVGAGLRRQTGIVRVHQCVRCMRWRVTSDGLLERTNRSQ